MTDLTIRKPTPDDDLDLSTIIVNAFGQKNEWLLIQALRQEGDVAIELVAEDADGLQGHICLSHLRLPRSWLTLAPLCVRRERQKQGIGGALVRRALDEGRLLQAGAVAVVGEPSYYARFGFVFGEHTIISPYPPQYTGLCPLAEPLPEGQAALVYPYPFGEV